MIICLIPCPFYYAIFSTSTNKKRFDLNLVSNSYLVKRLANKKIRYIWTALHVLSMKINESMWHIEVQFVISGKLSKVLLILVSTYMWKIIEILYSKITTSMFSRFKKECSFGPYKVSLKTCSVFQILNVFLK